MSTRILSCLFFGLFCLFSANPAFGQSYISYASSAGEDSNPCKANAPCRTINRALVTAGVGGTVMLTDAGPYDAFVINRSANVIAAPRIAPQILAFTNDTPAIRIALPRGEFAYLESLTVNTLIHGGTGIQWTTPSKLLWMKNCTVSSFETELDVTAGGNILVDTCTFSNGYRGIVLATRSETEPIYSTIQYTIVREMSGDGIYCSSNTDVGIRGCQISQCGTGIDARAFNASSGGSTNSHAYVTVTYSSIFNNRVGINEDWSWSSRTRTIVRLGYNSIYNNSGLGIWGGCNLGGNSVFGNGWPSIDDDWTSGRAPACPF